VVKTNLTGSVTPVVLELFPFLIALVVLKVQLFVLLALQSTTEAVTAVAAERFTIILNVKFMLELLVMVFTHTMVALPAILQHLLCETVLKLTLTTCLTHAYTLGTVAQVEPAAFFV
jgi:succinate dehydrogenase hydrophobic anchor subunit